MKELFIKFLHDYVSKIAFLVHLLNKKSKGIKGFTMLHNDGYLDDGQTISYRFSEGSNIYFKSNNIDMYFETLTTR